jgi:Protein of unknown function (DUF4038)/Putative collagen-binding domain of a collagenase
MKRPPIELSVARITTGALLWCRPELSPLMLNFVPSPASPYSGLSRWPHALAVALIIRVLLGATALAASVKFPVRPSVNARYLVDAAGQPFPILGRASWFVASLSQRDLDLYFGDCAKRGYTTLEFMLVGHDPRGNRVPFTDAGHAPFLKRLNGAPWDGKLTSGDPKTEAPDFTTPNEDYWKEIDALLIRCEKNGMLACAFPAYVGYGGNTPQGWMKEMEVNGPERMRAYGTFLAKRYRDQPNVVWMLGGDFGEFNAGQTAVEKGLLEGLMDGAPGNATKLRSAEWSSESIGTDQPDFGRYLTLNGAYSFDGYTADHARRAYAVTPIRPAFLLEEPYDEEFTDGTNVNAHASQPVRRFQWWGSLGSIGGYISGNGYIWPFGEKWRQHLDTPGARDMAQLNIFIRSIAWHSLVPSGLGGMRPLVTKGGSTERAPDFIAAAASLDGRLLVAYSPPDRWGAFAIDLGAMRGPARARWFDPTAGTYQDIDPALPNTGPHAFNVPGKNAAGQVDWVLVLDAE